MKLKDVLKITNELHFIVNINEGTCITTAKTIQTIDINYELPFAMWYKTEKALDKYNDIQVYSICIKNNILTIDALTK